MNCVRCKNLLVAKKYEGIEIDLCQKCGGIWLDEGELAQIVNIKEEKFSDEQIKVAINYSFTGIPKNEEESIELCPKCSTSMAALNFSFNSGVIIDRCLNGHGVWLDGKEVEAIQAKHENWDKEIAANKTHWIELIKKTETDGKQKFKTLDYQVPSRFLFNRLARVVMKIFD